MQRKGWTGTNLKRDSRNNIDHFLLLTVDVVIVLAPKVQSEIPGVAAVVFGLDEENARLLDAFLISGVLPVQRELTEVGTEWTPFERTTVKRIFSLPKKSTPKLSMAHIDNNGRYQPHTSAN